MEDNDLVTVDLYIFKVDPRFIEDSVEVRHICRVQQVGTPDSKWFAAGSLVELHRHMNGLPALNWYEIERDLDNKGGHVTRSIDIAGVEYKRLFQP